MRLVKCCCDWSFIIGRKHVYGAIYPAGLGQFPDLLSNTQRIMTREQFKEDYNDCWAHYKGKHKHQNGDKGQVVSQSD